MDNRIDCGFRIVDCGFFIRRMGGVDFVGDLSVFFGEEPDMNFFDMAVGRKLFFPDNVFKLNTLFGDSNRLFYGRSSPSQDRPFQEGPSGLVSHDPRRKIHPQ